MVERRTIFVQPNLFNPQAPIPDAPMVRRTLPIKSQLFGRLAAQYSLSGVGVGTTHAAMGGIRRVPHAAACRHLRWRGRSIGSPEGGRPTQRRLARHVRCPPRQAHPPPVTQAEAGVGVLIRVAQPERQLQPQSSLPRRRPAQSSLRSSLLQTFRGSSEVSESARIGSVGSCCHSQAPRRIAGCEGACSPRAARATGRLQGLMVHAQR